MRLETYLEVGERLLGDLGQVAQPRRQHLERTRARKSAELVFSHSLETHAQGGEERQPSLAFGGTNEPFKLTKSGAGGGTVVTSSACSSSFNAMAPRQCSRWMSIAISLVLLWHELFQQGGMK